MAKPSTPALHLMRLALRTLAEATVGGCVVLAFSTTAIAAAACPAHVPTAVEDRLRPVLLALNRAHHQHGMWSPVDEAAFGGLLGAKDDASAEARVALMDYYIGESRAEALACAVARDGPRSAAWLQQYSDCDIAPDNLPLPRDHTLPLRAQAQDIVHSGDAVRRCTFD